VNSNAQPTVTKYSKLVRMGCSLVDMNNRIMAIKQLPHLNNEDKLELNEIDQILTKILMTADWKCCRFNEYPWSPKLHQAFLEHWYWSLWLSELWTKWSYEATYNKILTLIKGTKLKLNLPEMVSSHQHQACQKLWEICRLAQTKCRECLNSLLKAATATKNKDKKSDTGVETGWGKLPMLLNGTASSPPIYTQWNLRAPNTITRGSNTMDYSQWQSNYGGSSPPAQQKPFQPSSQHPIHTTTTIRFIGLQWTHTLWPTNFQ